MPFFLSLESGRNRFLTITFLISVVRRITHEFFSLSKNGSCIVVMVIIKMIFVPPFGDTNVLMILVLWVDTKPLVVVEVFDTTAALEAGFLVGRRVMGL